jgi:aspartate ammonia-lyase
VKSPQEPFGLRRPRLLRGRLEARPRHFQQTVNVLDAIDMLTGAIDRFEAKCLRGLQANEARCRSLAAVGKAV